jgi:hypothetical protein
VNFISTWNGIFYIKSWTVLVFLLFCGFSDFSAWDCFGGEGQMQTDIFSLENLFLSSDEMDPNLTNVTCSIFLLLLMA